MFHCKKKIVNEIKGGIREGKKMLRDNQDILDVTLVCGNENGWRDKRNLLQGDWRRVEEIIDVNLVYKSRTQMALKGSLPKKKKTLNP